MNANRRIDVVIATYNRHERLNRCLWALERQTVQEFGVIVVDDGSSPGVDSTIASEHFQKLALTVIRTPANGGPGAARNIGVAQSTAELILFIDDDIDADPELIERHLEAIGDGCSSKVVIGPMLAPPDWHPTAWNRWEAEKLAEEYRRMVVGDYEPTWKQFFTGNALVRRIDFLRAGGFDERFTRAEDVELGLRLSRLGCEFVFEPRAKGWHYAHRSLGSWRNIPREYGRFDVAMDQLYPDLHWGEAVREQLTWRHPLGRLGRRLPPRLSTSTALLGARICARLGLTRAATAGLSLVFDGEYAHSVERALANPDPRFRPVCDENLVKTRG
jgi:GT2 family glycosyltransferase